MHLEEENQISENMRNVYSGVPRSSNYSLILLTGTLWVWEAKVTTTPGISFRPFFFFAEKGAVKVMPLSIFRVGLLPYAPIFGLGTLETWIFLLKRLRAFTSKGLWQKSWSRQTVALGTSIVREKNSSHSFDNGGIKPCKKIEILRLNRPVH